MKVEYINPFIEGVYDLMRTMLSAEAKKGTAVIAKAEFEHASLVALIGLTGSVKGTVAISFPLNTALAIVNRMLGASLTQVDGTVTDGIAEVLNIVAGSAKKRFTEEDTPPVTLTLPSVISGADYSVYCPSMSTWIEVPFESDVGAFTMRVTMESRPS